MPRPLHALALTLISSYALSYDVVCNDPTDIESGIVISSSSRTFDSVQKLDSGKLRRVFVKDMIVPTEVDDYVVYEQGKHRITYPLKCHKL